MGALHVWCCSWGNCGGITEDLIVLAYEAYRGSRRFERSRFPPFNGFRLRYPWRWRHRVLLSVGCHHPATKLHIAEDFKHNLRSGFCGERRIFITTCWSNISLWDLKTWQHWKSYSSPCGSVYRLLDITLLNTTIWTVRSIFSARLSWASVQKHVRNLYNYHAFSCW